MNRYRIRAQSPRALGMFTQYRDFDVESSEALETFVARLAAKGFQDPATADGSCRPRSFGSNRIETETLPSGNVFASRWCALILKASTCPTPQALALKAGERVRLLSRNTKDLTGDFSWVQPQVVVQIAFVEWTTYDLLRHASFLGLRRDKAAKDVRRESPRE